MKTLADLKRDLKPGVKLILKHRFGKEVNEQREVIQTQSNGLWFKSEFKPRTWLDYPKATLTEYDGKNIVIYAEGYRELTENEQSIRKNEPRDEEQERIDCLSDGSTMYYRQLGYYRQNNAEYLMGGQRQKGMVYDFNKNMVKDDNVKGVIALVYEVKP